MMHLDSYRNEVHMLSFVDCMHNVLMVLNMLFYVSTLLNVSSLSNKLFVIEALTETDCLRWERDKGITLGILVLDFAIEK